MLKRFNLTLAFIVLLSFPLFLNSAYAQDEGDGEPEIEDTCGHDLSGATFANYSNSYLSVTIGASGEVVRRGHSFDDAATMIETNWPVSGRWCVSTTDGIPLNQYAPNAKADENYAQSGATTGFAGSPMKDFGIFKTKIGDKVYLIGDTESGYWKKLPTATPKPPAGMGEGLIGGFIEGIWAINVATTEESSTSNINPNDIKISLADSGASDMKIDTAAVTVDGTVEIKIRAYIVRDLARFTFDITNRTATAQSVGITMGCDVPDGWVNRSTGYVHGVDFGEYKIFTTPFIPGVGRSSSTNIEWPVMLGKWSDATRIKDVLPSVPTIMEFYDDLANAKVTSRIVFDKGDATKPDFFAFGSVGNGLNSYTSWPSSDYDPDQLVTVSDFYWSATWEPQSIRSLKSRSIVTYYGLGNAETEWTTGTSTSKTLDWVALAAEAPKSLKFDSSLDAPSLSPAEFPITAYIYNMDKDPGPYTLSNVTLTLILDDGLELVSGSPTVSVGKVSINSESDPIVWNVRATGTNTGELTYRVSGSDVDGWSQLTAGKIIVPATVNTTLTGGYQMVNVPFTFTDSSIGHVLGIPSDMYYSWIWSPAYASYSTFSNVIAGNAFWVNMKDLYYGDLLPITMPYDATPISQDDDKIIKLSTGWNMFGNPFLYPLYWGQVMFYDPSSRISVDLNNAVTKGWISRILWSWNTDALEYDANTSAETMLLPWQGYWIKATKPLMIVLRPAVYPNAEIL